MKDAMGESTFTIIVILAAAAVLGFLMVFLPKILEKVNTRFDTDQEINYPQSYQMNPTIDGYTIENI